MNQTAAAMRAHLPAEDLRAKEVAGQVDGENAVPFGKRQSVERAGTQDGRGVDQHVARPERFLDRVRCGGDALGAGGVAADDEMAIAQFAQLRLRTFKPAFVTIDRRDAGTGAGETDGRGAADAAAPARHHANAA